MVIIDPNPSSVGLPTKAYYSVEEVHDVREHWKIGGGKQRGAGEQTEKRAEVGEPAQPQPSFWVFLV